MIPDIPITSVHVGAEEEKLVLEVLRSGQLAQGPMVERLEAGFATLAGVDHAIAVSSGTTALVAALQSLDLEPGDEVVTSPFTFIATLNAILEAGLVARFADIGNDFNLDPSAAAALVGPRTKAILPVHLYGLPAPMAEITRLAEDNDLSIVEDAAQAIGATYDGRTVGSFGIACFSLYATKNIMSGEGGVVTTSDAGLAQAVRELRNQGMRARYDYVRAGHNYRMTDLQAAVGVAQLDRLNEVTERRQRNAEALTAALDGTVGLILPQVPSDRTHVFHQYTVRVTPDARLDRDALATAIADADGIGSGVYYPKVVYDYDAYRSHDLVRLDDVPRAQTMASEVLSLPIHPTLAAADLERIAGAVRSALA